MPFKTAVLGRIANVMLRRSVRGHILISDIAGLAHGRLVPSVGFTDNIDILAARLAAEINRVVVGLADGKQAAKRRAGIGSEIV